MPSGCALVGRGDWIFSDVYTGELVRGAVFSAGEEGSGGSGWAVCAGGIRQFAQLAAGEYSSPWAAIFSARAGEESDRARFVVGAAGGASEGKSRETLWSLRRSSITRQNGGGIMAWMRRGW